MNPQIAGLLADHGFSVVAGVVIICIRKRLAQSISDDEKRAKREKLFLICGSIMVVCGTVLFLAGLSRLGGTAAIRSTGA